MNIVYNCADCGQEFFVSDLIRIANKFICNVFSYNRHNNLHCCAKFYNTCADCGNIYHISEGSKYCWECNN